MMATFWTYLKWSLEFLVTPPFAIVTACLVTSVVFSFFFLTRNAQLSSLRRPMLWWLLLLQFVCFPLTLMVAVVGQVPAVPFPSQEPHRWAIISGNALVIFSMLVGTAAVFKMKGQRWFVTSVTLLQFWALQGAGMIAASSLTGVWP